MMPGNAVNDSFALGLESAFYISLHYYFMFGLQSAYTDHH